MQHLQDLAGCVTAVLDLPLRHVSTFITVVKQVVVIIRVNMLSHVSDSSECILHA